MTNNMIQTKELLSAFFLILFALSANNQEDTTRGIYFNIKKYTGGDIPNFAASKDKLPIPILQNDTQWIDMYWKCWELAFLNVKKPPEGSPFVSNILDEAFSDNIFQWDMIFMVMFGRYAHNIFPAINSLDNFYCRQHPNGYICREISEKDGKDFVFKGRIHTINPPLFSWAEIESFKNTGEKHRFELVLPVLEKYVEWLNRDGNHENANGDNWYNYGRKASGSVHQLYWNTGFGSGMDNTPRGGNGWVDMSCQMVMQYKDLAEMCSLLGYEKKAKLYNREAQEIGDRINKWCWNEEHGLYYDVDNEGNHLKWKTLGCFWPLLAGIASKEQSDRLVNHLKDTSSFWRTIVFPTLAADQENYSSTGNYWLGGVWAPTNYMVIKGLEKYGYEDFAYDAVYNYLEGMYKVFEKTGTVWENYMPDFYEPGIPSKPDFVGWSGIGPIALLIENILGLRVDGANKRLTWHIKRMDRHGIENIKVGNINVSVIHKERLDGYNEVEIEIESDGDFELILYYLNNKHIFNLTKGFNAIKL